MNFNDEFKIGDKVEIDFDSNVFQSEFNYVEKCYFIREHFNVGSLQHCGEVVDVGIDYITYKIWQGRDTRTIKKMGYLKKSIPMDCNGVQLKKNDTVYIAIKNEIVKCKFIKETIFKHMGYGWVALGCQFEKPDGKKMTHFHYKGRLKAESNM